MSLVIDFDNTKRSRDDFANFRIEIYKMTLEMTLENFCPENFSIYNSIDYTQCLYFENSRIENSGVGN